MHFDKRKLILLLTLAIGIYFFAFYKSKKETPHYLTDTGRTFGTFYKITYESPKGKSYQDDFARIFSLVENSFSTFNKNSILSRINQNDTGVVVNTVFKTMFAKAEEVSQKTGGAFDITVAPLVNAWGFGFTEKEKITDGLVDSLLKLTGYQKVHLINGKVLKEEPGIMLDASGIAKGYSCDLAASFLDSLNVKNYLIDIGGEIVAKGRKENGEEWVVGIVKPLTDSIPMSEKEQVDLELQNKIYMENAAMATSGSYFQFYVRDGKKYAHIINPKTGYPVDHSLLSVTVIAPDCMTADAYATAFMVLGTDEGLALAEQLPGIEAYFIYSDEQNHLQEKYTSGFKKFLNPKIDAS